MAQSALVNKDQDLSIPIKMAVTKEELMAMDPTDVFDWEVNKLDEGLEALGVTIGTSWTKSRKAFELNKAMQQDGIENVSTMPIQSQDPNVLLVQTLQAMQEQMRHDREAMAAQIAAIGGGTHVGNNVGVGQKKSTAKGRHPEKLERDIDYATFLQWEKSLHL